MSETNKEPFIIRERKKGEHVEHMPKVNITEEEASLRRINIFKNRHRQFVYVRKWRKKAYVINKADFRYIGYYQNRIFLVLLVFMVLTILTNTVAPWPILAALASWGISEAAFEFLVVRHYSSTKFPEDIKEIGFVASAMTEDPKIVNIKIVSYFAVALMSGITAFVSKYEGIYLLGMIGIALYGFFQAVFYISVQMKRKKGNV